MKELLCAILALTTALSLCVGSLWLTYHVGETSLAGGWIRRTTLSR